MARAKTTAQKPAKKTKAKPVPQLAPRAEFLIRSHTLTPEADTILQGLSRDATDFIGRTVSGAAIIRALIRQAVQQSPPAANALFVLAGGGEEQIPSLMGHGMVLRSGEYRSSVFYRLVRHGTAPCRIAAGKAVGNWGSPWPLQATAGQSSRE